MFEQIFEIPKYSHGITSLSSNSSNFKKCVRKISSLDVLNIR
jgi:hypothetical protein